MIPTNFALAKALNVALLVRGVPQPRREWD